MLSTKSKRRFQSPGLTSKAINPAAEGIWTKETLREDAAVIVELFREGKLSQYDMEIILSLILSGYILSETSATASDLENALAEMLIEQLANNK